MAIYGYTKNYKLIKPKYDTDTWHDYEYDNLDTIDAVLSAIYASGNWKGFWATNTAYVLGDVVIDRDTDTMYKVMFDHTTSEATFAAEQTAHPDYYELWSPNNLAESWAIKTDDKVSNTDYSAKAYAISSGLISEGSAKEWATTASGHATAASTSAEQAATSANSAASSASSASTSATNAATSAELSQSWAVSDTLVNDTDYSAKHYANQANTNATNAANSATDSANSATSASASAQAAQNALNDVQGLIATPIGTIFQSIYVDESLDIARKLNGQLISSTKFTGFRSWLNTVQTALPNLFTTESNWQAEKTNSKLGQCGKFVIDDTAGTIRLPCVVNAQGLVDLALIGGIKAESLPNITGEIQWLQPRNASSIPEGTGAFSTENLGTVALSGTTLSSGAKVDFNASSSSSTYQDNAPVQQEAVQYPYYIQVATGVEETLPAIREYNINTPFFFGQSMYSDVDPDNASWLASNGQYNAKTVYPDYYNWILENINKGVKGFWGQTAYAYGDANGVTYLTTSTPQVGSVCYNMSYQRSGYIEAVYSDGSVKIRDDIGNASYDNIHYYPTGNISSTSLITDYDFVINTADQTFRLPLLNGDRVLVAKKEPTTEDTTWYNLYSDGWLEQGGYRSYSSGATQTINLLKPYVNTDYSILESTVFNGVTANTPSIRASNKTTNSFQIVAYDTLPASYWQTLGYAPVPAQSEFTEVSGLYYYVGDTVQDASLINAGAVLGQLSDKISRTSASDKELVVGWGMPDYTTGVKLTGSTYTATYKCWLIGVNAAAGSTEQSLYVNGSIVGKEVNDYIDVQIPLDVGDVVTISVGTFYDLKVYAMKGV